jgi:hemerythrin
VPHVVDWTDALKVGIDVIDTDHEVFVAEINAAVAASDEDFPTHFAELVEHTRAHFAREEALMDATGFFAAAIHKAEHQRVLAEAGRVADQLEAGDASVARSYVANHLPEWFRQHRDTMDLATASFARQHGYH